MQLMLNRGRMLRVSVCLLSWIVVPRGTPLRMTYQALSSRQLKPSSHNAQVLAVHEGNGDQRGRKASETSYDLVYLDDNNMESHVPACDIRIFRASVKNGDVSLAGHEKAAGTVQPAVLVQRWRAEEHADYQVQQLLAFFALLPSAQVHTVDPIVGRGQQRF